MTRYAANEAELPSGTLVDLFLGAVDRFGSASAFRRVVDGEWRDISYDQALEMAVAVAAALEAAGLSRGDRVALLSENRPEWALTDYGSLLAGVQVVPVYSTLAAADVRYLIENSEARLAFVSNEEQLEKIRGIRDDCPSLEGAVIFDPGDDDIDEVWSWRAFLDTGRTAIVEGEDGSGRDALLERARSAAPDDVATMIYTSGTTGPPKGVMLTHDNVHSNVIACRQVLSVGPDDVTLSILPLSHVLQRMVDFLFFHQGGVIAYPRSRETVPDDMRAVGPTVMVAVPRVYEKVYNKVMAATGARGALVEWAEGVAGRWADATLAGRRPGLWTRLLYTVADRLVFRKIRAGVGGRIRYFVSGGGPLSPEINRFFYSVGLKILEGYGLTETSPVTNVNTEKDFRIGTVGKPVPGTEIRIGESDEILVRGPQVMKGYFGLPEATAEAIDPDGWFHTGDVGEIDQDGFLRVTDRLKDLIITSGGKNIAPQPIENLLKRNRYVEQAVMVGDGRKFPAVLVVPSFANLERWAEGEGLSVSPGDHRELLEDSRVQELLEREIYGELGDLSRYELPKKVGLLTEELTVEGGGLTPTEKVKRRVVEERYRSLIDSFYREEAVDRTLFVSRNDDGAMEEV